MGLTADVLLTLLAVVFFGACWLYIRGCDAIIGSDADAIVTTPAEDVGAPDVDAVEVDRS